MKIQTNSTCRSVVAVIALLIVLVTSQDECTPETCPDGPVEVSFPTIDCSGTPLFRPFSNGPYNTCTGAMGSKPYYTNITVTSEGVEIYEGDSDQCKTDPTTNFQITFKFFYSCKRVDQASFASKMILPSVNATYHVHQNVSVINPSYPTLPREARRSCRYVDDCEIPNTVIDYWITHTDPISCEPELSIGEFQVSHNGTCYSDSDFFYRSYECVSEHIRIIKRYNGNGCQHLIEVETVQKVCSYARPTIAHCRASPIAPTPYHNPWAPVAPVGPVPVPIDVPAPVDTPTPSIHPWAPVASEPVYQPEEPIAAPTDTTPTASPFPSPVPSSGVPSSNGNALVPYSVLFVASIAAALF